MFGVNALVELRVYCLAAYWHPALEVLSYDRTAPELQFAYEPCDLSDGRRYKDATVGDKFLFDLGAAQA